VALLNILAIVSHFAALCKRQLSGPRHIKQLHFVEQADIINNFRNLRKEEVIFVPFSTLYTPCVYHTMRPLSTPFFTFLAGGQTGTGTTRARFYAHGVTDEMHKIRVSELYVLLKLTIIFFKALAKNRACAIMRIKIWVQIRTRGFR
jgi:hypothetical protein